MPLLKNIQPMAMATHFDFTTTTTTTQCAGHPTATCDCPPSRRRLTTHRPGPCRPVAI